MEALSLDLRNPGFTKTEFQLGRGVANLFLDMTCSSCNKKMYKEVIGLIITPSMIRKESALVCYRCGIIKRIKI